MITIIGLEKLAKTFGLSVNQIAKELGIGRQTIYDWLKGKRKIPKERIEQLSKLSEFSHVNKDLFQKEIDEVDELEIERAYFQELSAKHTEEPLDDEGNPFTLDPYYQHREAIEVLMDRERELKITKSLLQDDSYLEELNSSSNELYLLGLGTLNGTFQQKNVKKVEAVTELLKFINMNDMTNELNKDLKELLQKHDMFSGEDDWIKIILDTED
ncbi:helix-turn-helix domain-containing protein [Jeotgalibacillus sp. S-D1]|uniref:helix-turn-helix domain-containing protein n=1 Tax=Jeotgalibacillus sp. S-D1 TaxID=2552189 RepID=UPI001059D5CB|nr:helix-turn-helix domain-containing protein [Jeotgalibacillus sp. S-D1]TDL30705.1 helix-turn-helix domain-containing protein [Jeotgalibacillus sp. S-D1]